ncbi:hypothetical protein D3C87_1231180 [compost metagenome]
MLVERAIDLFEEFFQARMQPCTRLLLPDGRKHAQPQRRTQAIPHHTHLFNARMHRQAIFNRCRRHVFALAGLEDFLETPGQAQIAFGVLFTFVTGTQESVLGDGVSGFLRLLEVAEHGRAAAHQHLARILNAHFDLGARLADPAGFVLARQADVRVTTAFGHAVDLQHVQSQFAVPQQQGQRHRRRAGQGHAQRIEPQPGEDLMPYPLADNRQTEQKIEAFCRDLAVHAHLEFGPDAWNAKQRSRPRTFQVGEKGVEALGKKYGLPGINRGQLDEHPFGHMAQRQVGQQPVRLVKAKQRSAARGGEPQVAEAVHHAFGHAGSAGGIDDRRELIGGRLGVVLDRRAALQVGPAEIEGARRMQRQADRHQFRADPARHPGPVVEFANERQRRFRMLQHLGHGFGRQVRIQRHRDMACHPDREVGNDPVRAIFRDQGDVAALGQFPGSQPVCRTAGLMADVSPGQGLDLPTTHGLNQKALARMTRLTLVENVQRQTKGSRHATRSCFFGLEQA